MPDLVYKFAAAPAAAGRTVTVKDATTHETVTSGSFSGSANSEGVVTFKPTLDEGSYYGEYTVPGVSGVDGEKHPYRTQTVAAILDVPGSIEAGGGGVGAAETSMGTLYLKASGTAIDVSAEDFGGSGEVMSYELDTAKQGDSPIPEWVTQIEGGFSLHGPGTYITQTAGKGVITYPDAPDLIYIDVQDSSETGLNLAWASDGTDDSDAFTPAATTDLDFLVKDSGLSPAFVGNLPPADWPHTLVGLVGSNSGDLVTGATLDIDVRIAITKLVAGGERYVEADLT